jgi:hypothetical protein
MISLEDIFRMSFISQGLMVVLDNSSKQ